MTSITFRGLGAGVCFSLLSLPFFLDLDEGLSEGGCFVAAGG